MPNSIKSRQTSSTPLGIADSQTTLSNWISYNVDSNEAQPRNPSHAVNTTINKLRTHSSLRKQNDTSPTASYTPRAVNTTRKGLITESPPGAQSGGSKHLTPNYERYSNGSNNSFFNNVEPRADSPIGRKNTKKSVSHSPTHPGIEDGGGSERGTLRKSSSYFLHLAKVKRSRTLLSFKSLKRTGTMVRMDRAADYPVTPTRKNILQATKREFDPWNFFSHALTCCIPGKALKYFGGMKDDHVQQAWREKIALVFIFFCLMGLLAFITFAFNEVICDKFADPGNFMWTDLYDSNELVVFNGYVVNMTEYLNVASQEMKELVKEEFIGSDATRGFILSPSAELRNYAYGQIDSKKAISQIEGDTIGCIISESFLWLSLLVILSLILVKFFFAVYFRWFLSNELGKLRETRLKKLEKHRERDFIAAAKAEMKKKAVSNIAAGGLMLPSLNALPSSEYTAEVNTVLLVTCYSVYSS